MMIHRDDDMAPPRHGSAVTQAAAQIRALILRRQVLPGAQVRQEDLASQIGVSRGPTREALRILAAEGVLRYEPNRGYFVGRLTVNDMNQVYLLRDLLETEILRSLPAATPDVITRLRETNLQIGDAKDDVDLAIELNSCFHDTLFSLSELGVLKAELRHLAALTTAYQSLSLAALDSWDLVVSDHDRIIAALEAHDNEKLIDICREHRENSLIRLAPLLR
jgi:DNA-binding GntR family transcriptional regulator